MYLLYTNSIGNHIFCENFFKLLYKIIATSPLVPWVYCVSYFTYITKFGDLYLYINKYYIQRSLSKDQLFLNFSNKILCDH